MQAPHGAGLKRERVVVLDEVDMDSSRFQRTGIPGFCKEPAIIPEATRLENEKVGYWRRYNIHEQVVSFL